MALLQDLRPHLLRLAHLEARPALGQEDGLQGRVDGVPAALDPVQLPLAVRLDVVHDVLPAVAQHQVLVEVLDLAGVQHGGARRHHRRRLLHAQDGRDLPADLPGAKARDLRVLGDAQRAHGVRRVVVPVPVHLRPEALRGVHAEEVRGLLDRGDPLEVHLALARHEDAPGVDHIQQRRLVDGLALVQEDRALLDLDLVEAVGQAHEPGRRPVLHDGKLPQELHVVLQLHRLHPLQDPVVVLLHDDEKLRLLLGDDRARPRLAVEQGQLPEAVAAGEDLDVLAVLGGDVEAGGGERRVLLLLLGLGLGVQRDVAAHVDRHPPADDDEERVPLLPLLEHDAVRVQLLVLGDLADVVVQLLVHRLEEGAHLEQDRHDLVAVAPRAPPGRDLEELRQLLETH